MNSIGDFIQDNWYEMGSLIAQFGIVLILFWYGRMGLRLRPASEDQPEPGEGKLKASMAPGAAGRRRPETELELESEPEPYQVPSYAAARQREPEPRVRPYEIPPAFPAPERAAAGHGGVGRMLSPLPESPEVQAEPVRQRGRRQQAGILRATIKWLREPINAPRRVPRRAA